MDALRYQVELAAPLDRVWHAWSTAEGLAAWLCLRASVEATVGGAYELFWNPDASRPESDSTIGCRILALDPPRLLRFTWRGSDDVADVMNVPGAPTTQVQVELVPAGKGTHLEVVHSGWGEGAGWERARAWFDRAWTGALARLPEMTADVGPNGKRPSD